MNVQRYNGYYGFDLYNVAFFGRGWNPKPFRLGGHIKVLLATDLSRFVILKPSYEDGIETGIEDIDWTAHEVSYMNDLVLTELPRSKYEFTDATRSIWENIYGGENMVKLDNIWKNYHSYPFVNDICGLNPQYGDTVTDSKDGSETKFSYSQWSSEWITLVMRNEEGRFSITERITGKCSIKGFKLKLLI